MPLACVHARHACCTLCGRSLSTSAFSRRLLGLNKGTSRCFCCCLCTPLRLHGVEKEKTPPANKVKTTASRTLVYPTPTPLLSDPSRHISVMAPHRSRGLLVCTQCPLIGRIAKSLRGLIHVLWLCARPAVCVKLHFFFVFFWVKAACICMPAPSCASRRQVSVSSLCVSGFWKNFPPKMSHFRYQEAKASFWLEPNEGLRVEKEIPAA